MTAQRALASRRGPIQNAVAAHVAARFDFPLAVGVAARSPLGCRAIRLQPLVSTPEATRLLCRDIHSWLTRQPWIAGAIAAPTCVYVRPDDEWLLNSSLLPDDIGEFAITSSAVQTVPQAWDGVRTLQDWRVLYIGCAVRRLFPLDLASRDNSHAKTLTVAAGRRDDGGLIAVAPVDVENDAMKASNSGVVTPNDVLLAIRSIARAADNASGYRLEREAHLALAFIVGRVPRLDHVRIGLKRIQSDIKVCMSIASALTVPEREPPGTQTCKKARNEDPVELAIELDLFSVALNQAAEQRDPAPLLRYAQALSRRMVDSGPLLRPDVASAARATLRAALSYAGCFEANPGRSHPHIPAMEPDHVDRV